MQLGFSNADIREKLSTFALLTMLSNTEHVILHLYEERVSLAFLFEQLASAASPNAIVLGTM